MPTPIDPNQCRHCGLSPPVIVMPLLRGKPRGICNTCRRQVEQKLRVKSNLYKGYYNTAHNLTSVNYKTLASLKLGAYSLTARHTEAIEGYIVVKKDQIYVSVWNRSHLFHYDLFGVSTFLGNLNVFISKPTSLTAPNGASVELESVGIGLTLENVQDALVMYDEKLKDYAVKRIKAEIAAEKRAAMGK